MPVAIIDYSVAGRPTQARSFGQEDWYWFRRGADWRPCRLAGLGGQREFAWSKTHSPSARRKADIATSPNCRGETRQICGFINSTDTHPP